MNFIIKTLISAGAIAFLAFLLPGIHVDGNFFYVVLIALMLSLLNTFLRPILVFLTLPATIISLGLFLLVINAAIVMLTGKFMDGFTVDNFGWAFLFSVLLSIIVSVINNLFSGKKPNNFKNNGNKKVIIIEKD